MDVWQKHGQTKLCVNVNHPYVYGVNAKKAAAAAAQPWARSNNSSHGSKQQQSSCVCLPSSKRVWRRQVTLSTREA